MSGLSSGYTQLEYIQSSGTQYINTGFNPKSTSRVVMEFEFLKNATASPFMSRDSSNATDMFGVFNINGRLRSDFNKTKVSFPAGLSPLQKLLYDQNKNVCTIGSETITNANGTFSAPRPLFLFASNDSGTARFFTTGKFYSCRIFDNESLIRDFAPCKNASGVIGLYDTVGRQFYANAGTGTFTAGPEIIYEPDAPTNFTASVSGQTVALSWAAAANAAGYRLKRDGVQIAEQTGTTYTDTVPDGIALCTYALTAYNDAGESAAVTLLVLVHLELITDRTRADVANQTDKGFYNASDLNRVGAAVEYIAGRFAALGYACPVTVKKDWLTSDAPTASQMEAYRQNIVTLRSQIAVMASTPKAPASMAGLDYVKANNIEQILADIDFILQNMPAASRHCGVTVCGSKGVIA